MIKNMIIGIKELQLKVQNEELQREKVKSSEEYEEMNRLIASIKQDQADMMEGLPDSTVELETKRKDLFEYMKQTDTTEFEGTKLKVGKTSAVNIARAKEVMGADLGAYIKVTQNDIKDYAKQFKESDPIKAKEVLSCIETISEEYTGVDIK